MSIGTSSPLPRTRSSCSRTAYRAWGCGHGGPRKSHTSRHVHTRSVSRAASAGIHGRHVFAKPVPMVGMGCGWRKLVCGRQKFRYGIMAKSPRSVVRRGILPESRAHGIIRSVEVHDPACQSSLNTIHMCSIIISCLQCLQAPFWDALGPSYSRRGDAEQRLGTCIVSRPSCFLP